MANFKSVRPSKLETKRPVEVDTFSRHHHEVLPVPAKLSNLDFWQAYESFQRADLDGEGSLDEIEFARWVKAQFAEFAAQIDTSKLFSLVDIDNDGTISLEEFLAWIYQVPRAKRKAPVTLKRVSSTPSMTASTSSPNSPLSPKSTHSNFSRQQEPGSPTSPKTPMSPMSPTGRPSSQEAFRRTGALTFMKKEQKKGQMQAMPSLILQFTVGPDFDTPFPGKLARDACRTNRLRHCIHETNGDNVEARVIVDPNVKGCAKVVAIMGSGITLWKAATMMTLREDPFYDLHGVEEWVRSMTKKYWPLFMRVQNL